MSGKQSKRKASKKDYTPVSITDLESLIVHESLAKKKFKSLDSPCRIHIHSQRGRLADADGVSAKAAIDGTVHAGLLFDDSPKYVEEVSYSQEKVSASKEETILEFYVKE